MLYYHIWNCSELPFQVTAYYRAQTLSHMEACWHVQSKQEQTICSRILLLPDGSLGLPMSDNCQSQRPLRPLCANIGTPGHKFKKTYCNTGQLDCSWAQNHLDWCIHSRVLSQLSCSGLKNRWNIGINYIHYDGYLINTALSMAKGEDTWFRVSSFLVSLVFTQVQKQTTCPLPRTS